jgi:hypothetical protein
MTHTNSSEEQFKNSTLLDFHIQEDLIPVHGKRITVPSLIVDSHTIIRSKKFISIAKIKEEWDDDVDQPTRIIESINQSGFGADLFTFVQKIPDSLPKFNYFYEMDNVAAIPISTYEHWWKKQIPKQTRQKVIKAERAGVKVRMVDFNSQLVDGIMKINNESPVRQGMPYYHYGKDFDTVERENGTYLDRSIFLGAYFSGELIGYIKLVKANGFTRTMQIVAMLQHRDKAPMNALMANAVNLCINEKSPYLVYGKIDYNNTGSVGLRDFKKNNGFQKIELPRYYIPLNTKGTIVLNLNMHHGIIGLIPKPIVNILRNVRSKLVNIKMRDLKVVVRK